MSGGLRLDYFDRYTKPVTFGATTLFPDRNITFPQQQVVRYEDLSPRMGVAIDLFGNGKTALKASLNRYVQDLSLLANSLGSAVANYQVTAARSWTDSNGNFYPDCDFTNPGAQNLTATGGDRCGAFTGVNANFNSSVPTSVDDHAVDYGFNHRGDNWEFSTSLQQELVPRHVAIDAGFFRRWYGNFTVTDNFQTTAADYTAFSVVVPTDPRLSLSGQTITGFLDTNSDKASLPSDNHVRFSSNYGAQYEHWQGIDVSASVRFAGGTVQGGLSTGKQVTDNCAVLQLVPEGATNGVSLTGATANIAGPLATPFCHQEQPWLTQVKALGIVTIPVIDLQLSGTFQSIPGPQIQATLVVPDATVKTSLGRDLSGGATNVTVNIVAPGSQYGQRLYQTDFRVGKIIRFGEARRATASVDLFNLFNGNSVLQQNSTYSTTSSIYGTPQLVQQARLLKFTLSVTF
jgi:hypothetical protein